MVAKKVTYKPKKTVKKQTTKKQKGGSCLSYSLLSDVYPKPAEVISEVKSIMNESLEGTKPMTETQAMKTVDVVVDTVKEVAPQVPKVDIKNAVIDSISKNNVQNGGKKLRKTYMKKTKKTTK